MNKQKFEVVPGDYTLAASLAENMWDVDREDLKLSVDLEPLQGLQESLRYSDEAWFILRWGKPVCVGGVAPFGEVGVPWFLAAQEIETLRDVQLKTAIVSRRLVRRWAEQFNRLENFILAKHKRALHWCEWLGFSVGAPQVWGTHHQEFCRICLGGE